MDDNDDGNGDDNDDDDDDDDEDDEYSIFELENTSSSENSQDSDDENIWFFVILSSTCDFVFYFRISSIGTELFSIYFARNVVEGQ